MRWYRLGEIDTESGQQTRPVARRTNVHHRDSSGNAGTMGHTSDAPGKLTVHSRFPGLRQWRSLRALTATIGPEMVSGASDNDPTNVGVAAVVGAQTAYRLSWIAVLVAPLLGVVQVIAAQVGVVARNDLQSLTRQRYGRAISSLLLVSVVIVNIVTIAADFQAGAAGIGLLAGVDMRWIVLPFGLGVAGLLLIGKYEQVLALLRFLLLGFLAFGVAAILAHPDWTKVVRATLIPSMSFNRVDLTGALAILGTTLTSYVYIWETVERGLEDPIDSSTRDTRLTRARAGAIASSIFTALIFWFMLTASAATLGRHLRMVTSAQQAAAALRPLAGSLAANMFAVGLIGSALIALPVLVASTGYVVGGHFHWRRGLSKPFTNALAFYAILLTSIGLAGILAVTGISVLGLLVAASVIGGIGAPVGITLLVSLARDPDVMGDHPISRPLAFAGWFVALVVGSFGLLFAIGAALGKL